MAAIREACPGVILNQSTGTIGPDIEGPLACLEAVTPEIAACNAGSLNYLKVKADGSWAWPPRLFDNPVEKVRAYLEVMAKTGTKPEFECFDTGIVRCVEMYVRNGMYQGQPQYNFVMGVESGMPADPALLPILRKLILAGLRLAGHRHRPRRHLGAARARGRARRPPAHRPRGHLLSARRPQGPVQRRAGRGAGAMRARCRPRTIATPAEARVLMGLGKPPAQLAARSS